jgi:hypothetical protein
MGRRLRSWLLGGLTVFVPSAVLGHHSVAYYSGARVELTGEITDVRWQNPHIRFALRTIEDDGAERIWRLESSSIFLREKDGVTRDLFKVGDRVRVFGRTSPQNPADLLVTNMLLPDGREAPLWPNTEPHFVSADKWITATPELVDAAVENRGIFRVWRPNQASLASLPYTAAAIAARNSFDMLAAAERCGPEGMPRIMITLFPYEFVDRGNEILLRAELYDTERIVHMDRSAAPADEPPSALGYSIGEWRDGALLIKTDRLNWPYFDQIGTPLSANVLVEERYTLSEDQTRLDVQITVTDPATFESPAIIRNSWLAYGDTIRRYGCQKAN